MSEVFNQINSQDLNGILERLGFHGKKHHNYVMYRSPLRKDNISSFSVFSYHGKWRWKDHGTGENGTVVDFLLRYNGWSLLQLKSEFERGSLMDVLSLFPKPTSALCTAYEKENIKSLPVKYTYEVRPLTDPGLLAYLKSRGIDDLAVWAPYLKEMHVRYGQYPAVKYIGFKNDFGGWAVRNQREKSILDARATRLLKGPTMVHKKPFCCLRAFLTCWLLFSYIR